eukprot:Gb_06428 [translate_table: standard]
MSMARINVSESRRPLMAVMGIVAVIVAGGVSGVMGQSGCTTAIVSLSPCLNYITGNVTKPPQSCCTALNSVVKTNAVCLCQLFANNNPLGFPVNQTRALALPGLCNVKTPPLSQCKATGGPAKAPVASPGPAQTTPSNTIPPPTTSVGGNLPLSPGATPTGTSGVPLAFTPSTITLFTGLILASITVW